MTFENSFYIDDVDPIETLPDTVTPRLVFAILNGLILFFTVIGCSFFLYLFYKQRKHRKIAHNYVISMCCGDIFHSGLGCGMVIHFCAGLKLSDDFCPIATSYLMISVYVSLLTLTTTAIDRYLAVCRPVMYQSKMSHNISYGIIVAGWILAVIFGLGLLIMRSDTYRDKPNELCLYLSWVYDPQHLFGYLILIMSIFISIIVFLYIKIYISLRRVFASNLGTTGIVSMLSWIKNHNKQKSSDNILIGFLKVREVKVTCIMFTTVISFVLCWTPCIIVVLAYNSQPNVATTKILISYIFPKFYSMINPIFYAYTIKDVRKAFKRDLTVICCGNMNENETDETYQPTTLTKQPADTSNVGVI